MPVSREITAFFFFCFEHQEHGTNHHFEPRFGDRIYINVYKATYMVYVPPIRPNKGADHAF